MHIVKVLWVLISKKDAAVSMRTSVLEISNAKSKEEIIDWRALQQSQMQGAANLGLIVALSPTDRQYGIAIDTLPRPR
jgi:hypothetical protein